MLYQGTQDTPTFAVTCLGGIIFPFSDHRSIQEREELDAMLSHSLCPSLPQLLWEISVLRPQNRVLRLHQCDLSEIPVIAMESNEL